jgi:nucleotide-binding universal stress UspA family protein
MNEIVVGVDLSPSAREAMTWAAEQARSTGKTLRAIHAVNLSPTFNMALGMGSVSVPMADAETNNAYCKAVAAVYDSVQPESGWQLKFLIGEAGSVLVAESVGAALLVVGTKEHVGMGRLISGSVSHYCISHAECPIVAVPARRDREADQDHDQIAAAKPAPA